MALRRALACATAVEGALAALNLEQSIESAVLGLRQRVYVADGLVTVLPHGTCDSALDGPHCGHAGVSREGAGAPAASLADGILSSRLFSSSGGEELLDETVLAADRLASQGGSQASGSEERRTDRSGREHPGAASGGRRKGRKLARARSALLSFKALEPWRKGLPTDFAGRRGGFPFSVRWIGPWSLVSNPLESNQVVKTGRFVAQLRGPFGSIRFGRAVHLQAVDLAQPRSGECVQGLARRPAAAAAGTAVPPPRSEAPPPLVIRGWRDGREVFTEVVPQWELGTFVNGVAFTALTTVEVVDEVTLLAADCLLVAAVQATFGADMHHLGGDDGGAAEQAGAGAPAANSLLITMREGWRAYGWEEIEFRPLARVPGITPVWNLDEVVDRRLLLRPGVFEDPPRITEDQFDEQDNAVPGVGPEPLRMPPGLEEIVEAGPVDPLEPLDLAMTRQRNATVLASLASVLRAHAADPEAEGPAKLLFGLTRSALNEELLRLLRTLTEAAEGASGLIVGAVTGSQAFDLAWRRLGLHSLDTLLIRWHTATAAALNADQADDQDFADEEEGAGAMEVEAAAEAGAIEQVADHAGSPASAGGHTGGLGAEADGAAWVQAVGEQADDHAAGARAAAGRGAGPSSSGEAAFAASSSSGEGAASATEARLTELLVACILRAEEAVGLRVRAKNRKLADFTKASTSAAKGALGGLTAASFGVRIEPSQTGDGMSIVVSDGQGREATSLVKMGSHEIQTLLQALDPSSVGGTGSEEEQDVPGAPQDDAQAASDELQTEVEEVLASLQWR